MAWGRRRSGQRKLPPIRVWTEVIDDTTVAGLACCHEVRIHRSYSTVAKAYVLQRMLYAASCFVILTVDRSRGWGWQAREAATARLVEMTGGTAHALECIGPADGVEE